MPYDTSLHDKRIGRMRADLSEGRRPESESKSMICERGRFLSLMYAQYKISDVSQFIAVENTPGNSDIHRSYPVIVSSQFGKGMAGCGSMR